MNSPRRFGKSKFDHQIPSQLAENAKKPPIYPMQRPRISTNLAISADGKITSADRRPSGWTSKKDHARLMELRMSADAILVGMGTLIADRMTLTSPGKSTPPLRCVISRSRSIDPEHPIFHRDCGPIHLVITGEKVPPIDPMIVDKVTIHHMPLEKFLDHLKTKRGVQHLHCEGGGELIRSLAAMDAIDEFHATFAAHTIFAGENAATATGKNNDYLQHTIEFELKHFEPDAALGECFLSYGLKAVSLIQ
jgi:riboflavin-specific deaminase-like protein